MFYNNDILILRQFDKLLVRILFCITILILITHVYRKTERHDLHSLYKEYIILVINYLTECNIFRGTYHEMFHNRLKVILFDL